MAFPNECPEFNRQCIRWYPTYPNDTMRRHCSENVPCSDCNQVISFRLVIYLLYIYWNNTFFGCIKISFDMLDLQICHAQQRCFDMKTRRDPTLIGTDEYGNSIKTHYHCTNGYCSEIHSLKCERRCNEKVFNTTGKNTFIFNGERIIIAR